MSYSFIDAVKDISTVMMEPWLPTSISTGGPMLDSLVWWWKVEVVAFFANAVIAVGQSIAAFGQGVMRRGIATLQRSVTDAKTLNAQQRAARDA